MLDYVGMFIHGVVLTHIDALCHLPTEDGRMWNDRPMAENRMPATRNGTVDFLRDGIVTRGVLYDVPGHRGTDLSTGPACARLGAGGCGTGRGSRAAPG